MSLTAPNNLTIPFANTGDKDSIPTASNPNIPNLQDGYPIAFQEPLNTTGEPILRTGMNGILNRISSHTAWLNSGGTYTYDATLAAAGNYNIGTILFDSASKNFVISLVDNNTSNFVTTPSLIDGIHWQYLSNYNNLDYPFKQSLSSTDNLNDIQDFGIYYQDTWTSATHQLNYPQEGHGGMLEVHPSADGSYIYQTFLTSSAAANNYAGENILYARILDTTFMPSPRWTAWNRINPIIEFIDPNQDLNSFFVNGSYFTENTPLIGKNYPSLDKGLLEVHTVGYMTIQRYSIFANPETVFSRRFDYDSTTLTWGPWALTNAFLTESTSYSPDADGQPEGGYSLFRTCGGTLLQQVIYTPLHTGSETHFRVLLATAFSSSSSYTTNVCIQTGFLSEDAQNISISQAAGYVDISFKNANTVGVITITCMGK